MRTAQDIVDYLDYCKLGQKGKDAFVTADKYDFNRPIAIVVKEAQSSKAADVTINADYMNINIKVSGNYNKSGGNKVHDTIMRIYRALRLKTDVTINGHHYHYIMALTPPIESGFDEENGISTFEFNCEVMRSLGGE